ncbi:hypothetical protein AJ78_02446 [Emergomyces pasteurianus Ep9510]|uniref:DUF7730 domain-containing protein n=1 Tax=Emergomyces pasteurianus Ep9510 TaxID=1447872 RepID=A0A1J9PM14_9EURO|nr:hypothetical protein AJ78_02446 [Emergomyces pasteurianus Ep9510]
MPNPYYTFPPDAPLYSSAYCHNRSDKSPPLRPRLPTCRRRGITHPLPDWVESPFSNPWAFTDPQSRCTLYTELPPEIRFLIFEALLGNRVLHVKMIYHSGYRVLKACRETGVRWKRKFWNTIFSGYNDNITVDCQCGHGSEDSLCLEVLRTCRRIYSECIPILYTRNTFNFNRDADPALLVSKPVQKRFQCVTSIELSLATRNTSYYPSPTLSRTQYQRLLAPFSYLHSMKVIRLYMKELPQKLPHDGNDDAAAADGEGGVMSWEEFWLAPVDDLVRRMASTLEELEFVIPALCFELLSAGSTAGALGGDGGGGGGGGGSEEAVLSNELRGGKRCRRRLEGLRPGVQYFISCPAEPGPDQI